MEQLTVVKKQNDDNVKQSKRILRADNDICLSHSKAVSERDVLFRIEILLK